MLLGGHVFLASQRWNWLAYLANRNALTVGYKKSTQMEMGDCIKQKGS